MWSLLECSMVLRAVSIVRPLGLWRLQENLIRAASSTLKIADQCFVRGSTGFLEYTLRGAPLPVTNRLPNRSAMKRLPLNSPFD